MTFVDTYDARVYTLFDLFKQWQDFRKEDNLNHADNFKTELFRILMATVNGRNDFDVIGLTPKEISSLILKLKTITERS